MIPIKAILIKSISFTSFEGHARTVKPGQVVDVVQVTATTISTRLDGSPAIEVDGSFIGTYGNDSFDLERDEFKTID